MIRFSESKNFSLIAFLLFPVILFSQPGTWMVVYGGINFDRGKGICRSYDDGFVVSATTSSYGMGNTDFYLLKINSAGKFQWQTTFGDINIENCFSIRPTSDSGFVLCGYTNSFGNGGYDAFLVKTDLLGNLQWQQAYGGNDWDFGYWTEQTNDGGYILCGETFSYGNGRQGYLSRTNSKGDTLWTRSFGNTNDDIFNEVHQTSDGGFITAGFTVTDAGDKNFLLLKTDSDGNKQWERTFGGTLDDACNSVYVCSDGGFALGGYSMVGTQKKNSFVKTNDTGAVIYLTVDTPGNGNREIYRIRENMEGEYYTSGWTDVVSGNGKDILINKWFSGFWFDKGGSAGGTYDEEGYDIVETPDSGYVVVGYTSTFGMGVDNIIIIKTNKNMGYNSSAVVYVSAGEIHTEENISVYPNPFTDKIFFQPGNLFEGEKRIRFSITDLCGKKIINEEKQIIGQNPIELKIPENNFSNGLYLLTISSANRSYSTKMIFAR